MPLLLLLETRLPLATHNAYILQSKKVSRHKSPRVTLVGWEGVILSRNRAIALLSPLPDLHLDIPVKLRYFFFEFRGPRWEEVILRTSEQVRDRSITTHPSSVFHADSEYRDPKMGRHGNTHEKK